MSIQDRFSAAVDIIRNLPQNGTFQPSEDLLLKLYGFYMQATEGPCNISKPSVWYYSSRIKWTAWNDLGNMEKEVAMEKYVEELTKVIETMSYNEYVSRFMSLIGPFYEFVPTDEADLQAEKKSGNKSCTEYSFPVRNLEELQLSKSETSHIMALMQNSSNSEEFSFYSSENSSTKSAEPIKCDTHTDSASANFIPQQNAAEIFKTQPHQPFVSQSDMLILTIINLQNSLEEIGQKLESLQNLARSAKLDEKENEDVQPEEWTIGVSGTALAFLWPIVIHLCTRSF